MMQGHTMTLPVEDRALSGGADGQSVLRRSSSGSKSFRRSPHGPGQMPRPRVCARS